MRARLITIPVSHYCERARWALDYCGVDYHEEQHLQVFHRRHVLAAGGTGSTPTLTTAEGTLSDSADIVAYADRCAAADQKLYPSGSNRDEISRLELAFAQEYGVESRRLAYFAYFPHKQLLLRYNAATAPSWERWVLQATFPLVRRFLTRELEITAEAVERGRPVVERTLELVATRLADGRQYLCGDRFTAADLTFAALTGPLVVPEQYGVPLPPLGELPEPLRGMIVRFRAHPAGAYALRLYARHRRS